MAEDFHNFSLGEQAGMGEDCTGSSMDKFRHCYRLNSLPHVEFQLELGF